MIRLPALALLALSALVPAQSQACFAAGDNGIFEDGISTGGPNLLIGIRETSGNVPLTVFAIEVFTGERPGTNTVGIWSDDPVNNRPGVDLGTGSFTASAPNGWQGANLPVPVTILPNTTFWIVWGPQNGAQSSIEQRNASGAGQPYRGSFDGGQSWNGPFSFYDWKYRLWCQPIANPGFAVFGTACPAGSRTQPRIGISALPRLGTSVDLTVVYSNSFGQPAFLGLGFSDRTWAGGIPLPYDLAALGAPSCSIHVDLLEVASTVLSATGNANIPLAVPNQAALLGATVFAQWIVADPQATALGFVTSAGGRLTVGN